MKFKILYSLIITVLFYLPLTGQNEFYSPDYIREIRMYFDEPGWKSILDSLFVNVGVTGRLEASVSIDGHMYNHAGVRYKGYSSWNSGETKNPFNIELDYKLKNQNHMGFSKIKLSNVIHDPSFVREVLSYEIVRSYMPASGANFARLFINDTLIGLYTNVEAAEIPLIERNFNDHNGVFFKGDPENLIYPFGQNANLALTHGTDSNSYIPYYKLESDYGWSQIYRLIGLLDNQPDSFAAIMNVDQVLWMHALNYVLVNLDSYIGYSQNYYMYQDNHGRFNPLIWDLNMSFASFRQSDGSTNFMGLTIKKAKELDPLGHLSFSISPRPLMTNLFKIDKLKRRFIAHMRTILDDYFRNGYYYERAHTIRQLIDFDVQQDTNRFYSYDEFLLNLDTTVGSSGDQYPGIRELMEARLAYLDSYPGFQGEPEIVGYGYSPAYPDQGSILFVRAYVSGADTVEVSYRSSTYGLFNTVLMYDDGAHNDSLSGDGIYGAAIPVESPVVQWYYYAENDSAGAFLPQRAETEFFTAQAAVKPGDLAINELLINNSGIQKDQDGESDPWIELLNITNEKINLEGFSLATFKGSALNWTFPDTTVGPHSFLIVWLDGDQAQQGLHTGFTLPGSDGSLYFLNNTGSCIDSVFFGTQLNDKSFGRFPNGYGQYVYMKPTYAENNYIASAGIGRVLLYPNPVRDILYLEGAGLENQIIIKEYNVTGQLIYEKVLDTDNGSFLNAVSINGLSDGIYLIRVESGERVLMLKYIKE